MGRERRSMRGKAEVKDGSAGKVRARKYVRRGKVRIRTGSTALSWIVLRTARPQKARKAVFPSGLLERKATRGRAERLGGG